MATHRKHDDLPGYDPGNLWHDGCPECEKRAQDPLHGMTTLDQDRLRQAWQDMIDNTWGGGQNPLRRRVSDCDARLHGFLYVWAVVMQRATGKHPTETLEEMDEWAASMGR